MKKGRKRLVLILVGVVAFLLVLVVGGLISLPHLVNMEKVKSKVAARLSREIKGEVEFKRIGFRLFPSIRVVIQGGKVGLPQKAQVSVDLLQVGIEFMPLLKGKVVPTYVKAEGVKGWFRIESGGQKKGSPLVVTDEGLKALLTRLSRAAPGVQLILSGGNFTLYRGRSKEGLVLSNVNARVALPPDRLKFDLSLSSSVAPLLKAQGWLSANDLKGELKLRLEDLRLPELLAWLSIKGKRLPREALVNLQVSGEMEGVEKFNASVVGSLPLLSFEGRRQEPPIVCKDLRVQLTRNGSAWSISLVRALMGYPRIDLRGRFQWDLSARKVGLLLEGNNVDVPSVRKVALFFAGGHRTVRKIFHIVREGKVPSITFTAQGSDFKSLGSLDHMVIKGSIEKGTIVIPQDLLTIRDVGGKVLISKGILWGKDLVGRLGNSRILWGTLRLGLRGKDLPLKLEAKVDADLSQLPGILKRVLKGGLLLTEIRKVESLKGRALGRLVLGESTRVERVEVEARKLKFSCRYQRVPYPIRIEGGSFYYKGSHVQVEGLRGSVGKSSFENLSAKVDWGGKGLHIKVASMTGSLALGEIFPWLVSYGSVRQALKDFSSMEGVLRVKALSLEGPLTRPQDWKFRMSGEMEGFSMDFSLFPDTLKVGKGQITMTPQVLSFKNCRASLLDAQPRVSGSITDYMQGVSKLDLSLDGPIGPKAAHWIYSLIELPKEYRFKSPLTLKGCRLLWESQGRTDFSGEISVGGARVDMDLEVLGDLLLIRKLALTGIGSSATIGLTFQGKTLSLNFKGILNKDFLDALLEENRILEGWVKGDFALYMVLDKMADFSAKGELEVKGLTYLWGVKMPVGVEDARVKACGTGLDIERAFLSLQHSSLGVKGKVKLANNKLHLDLDISAPSMDVKEIEDFFGKGGDSKPKKRWDLPIEGEVRARIFSLFYKDYAWSPVRAEIQISSNQVRVDVKKALLCGISTPGVITFTPGNMTMDVKVRVHNRDFDSTVSCLFGEEHLVKGIFSLEGELKASGGDDPIAENSLGEFHFKAKDGRVYRLTLLAKIFSILNVTEIFRGKVPDLTKEGFAYSSMEMKARFKNGVLLVDEGVINGASMRIFTDGKIDFVKNRMSLTVLVAPFKTIDTILSHIPLLGRILTGKSKTLVSIPVKVTGPLDNPSVIPMSPTAVGSGILGIMKRTLEAPVRIIVPPIKKLE